MEPAQHTNHHLHKTIIEVKLHPFIAVSTVIALPLAMFRWNGTISEENLSGYNVCSLGSN